MLALRPWVGPSAASPAPAGADGPWGSLAVGASLWSLPRCPTGIALCLLPIKTPPHRVTAHLEEHLNAITAAKPCFQIRSHSRVLGVGTSTYHFGQTQFSPLHHFPRQPTHLPTYTRTPCLPPLKLLLIPAVRPPSPAQHPSIHFPLHPSSFTRLTSHLFKTQWEPQLSQLGTPE